MNLCVGLFSTCVEFSGVSAMQWYDFCNLKFFEDDDGTPDAVKGSLVFMCPIEKPQFRDVGLLG